MAQRIPAYERFLGKVGKCPHSESAVSLTSSCDCCHEWQGARLPAPDNYGMFSLWGKMTNAHRAAWTLAYGPIPKGLYVCHRCDNPPCVRLEHLFLGTPTDNNRDMASKGRGRGRHSDRSHCEHGHEWTPANTIWKVTPKRPRPYRVCVACEERRKRERQALTTCPRCDKTLRRSSLRNHLRGKKACHG